MSYMYRTVKVWSVFGFIAPALLHSHTASTSTAKTVVSSHMFSKRYDRESGDVRFLNV